MKAVLVVGPLRIDSTRYLAEAGSRRIRLTPTELLLLWALAMEPGTSMDRDELLRRVWGTTIHVSDRTVDVHIKNLRRKFRMARVTNPRLETEWGYGYRLMLIPAGRRGGGTSPSRR
jgi:DNA-binding response OmpR family regulator